MRTFAQKPKATQKTNPAESAKDTPTPSRQHHARFAHDFSRIPLFGPSPPAVQTKLAVNGASDRYEREADRVADQVLRAPHPPLPSAASNARPGSSPVGPGRALAEADQAFFGARLAHDFHAVRVHTDSRAAEFTAAIQARAATLGNHIAFAPGEYGPAKAEGQRLLAHELVHVVQQSAAPAGAVRERASTDVVQRYESGEHAELGDARNEVQALIDGERVDYVVKPGERLDQLARKFGVTVEALKTANAARLRTWDAFDGSGRKIAGFNTGDTIVIPPVLNAETEAALKSSSGTNFTVNGVTMDYGVGIAMGDFFESPEQMAKASVKELTTLATLIKRERSGGRVTTDEWEAATGGRYLKLAEKNESHFAPPNTSLAPASGKGTGDHKTEWEKHHTSALRISQRGDKDEAMRSNAFGDHFLTDAFAGGHLINKRDVMQLFQSNLVDANGKFTGDANKFFDEVAKSSLAGDVKKDFSEHETVEFKGVVFRPNINSVSRFAALLKGIHEKEPDLLSNAIAKAVHDALNTSSGGIPVRNDYADTWKLSGDGALNADSKKIARKAVAQSQLNVLQVFNAKDMPSITELLKKVWDYVPRLTKEGTKLASAEVKTGTDPTQPRLVAAVARLITSNHKKILDELVKRKILKKA